jgi:hypothetical protein
MDLQRFQPYSEMLSSAVCWVRVFLHGEGETGVGHFKGDDLFPRRSVTTSYGTQVGTEY